MPPKTEEPMPRFVTHETESVLPEVEQIIQQLEATQTDITTTYADWRNIGFAFADAFGENGRALFHRVSRFHQVYSTTDCDAQFTNCLKSTGHGITLKTFFYLTKQAGIGKPLPVGERFGERPPLTSGFVSHETESRQPLAPSKPADHLPTFPDPLFPQLPHFLKEVVSVATAKEERDIILLGALGAISSCFPHLYGIYDGKKVHANLFLFITAKASAGKGRLVHCRQLVAPVHKRMREQARLLKQQYDLEMAAYNKSKGQ